MTTAATRAKGFSAAEQMICRLARVFDREGVGIGATVGSLIAARLAKVLYQPDLVLVTVPDPHTGFDVPVGPVVLNQAFASTRGSVMTSDWPETFHMVSSQRYVVVMGPPQIDRHGGCNISRFGPDWNQPKVQLSGSRGAPDDTVRLDYFHYHMKRHTPRTFVDQVEFRSAPGHTTELERLGGSTGKIGVIVSELGVFVIDSDSGTMKIESLSMGVDYGDVRAATGFELPKRRRFPVTEPPTAEELDWIRNRIDPLGMRRLDYESLTPALLAEFCEAEQKFWDVSPNPDWQSDLREACANRGSTK